MNYKKELNNIYNKLVQKAQLGLKVQSYSDGSVENGANKDIYNTPEYAENYSKGLYYGEDPQGRIYLQENANPELARYAKFVQDYPFEKYMNDTYFSGTTGAIAKGLGIRGKFKIMNPYVTIPTAGITGLGASQIELKQKGGSVDYTKLPYDPKDIRDFYGKMIQSDWYKNRLEKNGYESGYFFQDDKVRAQDVANQRVRRVNGTRVFDIDYLLNKYDQAKNSTEKDNFSGLLDNIDSVGSYYDGRNIYFENKVQPNTEKAHPRTIITHEYGHAETGGFPLSEYESNLLKSKISDPENRSTHDMSANERKADINTIRYNLYKAGLFDPSTGKYKTPSGKFEPSLLEKTRDDFSTKRSREIYSDKDLSMLMNTIAQNDSNQEELRMARKGGIIDELRILSEKFKAL